MFTMLQLLGSESALLDAHAGLAKWLPLPCCRQCITRATAAAAAAAFSLSRGCHDRRNHAVRLHVGTARAGNWEHLLALIIRFAAFALLFSLFAPYGMCTAVAYQPVCDVYSWSITISISLSTVIIKKLFVTERILCPRRSIRPAATCHSVRQLLTFLHLRLSCVPNAGASTREGKALCL